MLILFIPRAWYAKAAWSACYGSGQFNWSFISGWSKSNVRIFDTRLYQVDTNCSQYSSFSVPFISLTRDITWIISNWSIATGNWQLYIWQLIVASFDRSAEMFMTDSTEMSVTKLFESSSRYSFVHITATIHISNLLRCFISLSLIK